MKFDFWVKGVTFAGIMTAIVMTITSAVMAIMFGLGGWGFMVVWFMGIAVALFATKMTFVRMLT